MTTEQYWIERAERRVLAGEKTATEMLKGFESLYDGVKLQIDKEVQAFYGRYSTQNEITLIEAHKRIDPTQLKAAKKQIKLYYARVKPENFGIYTSPYKKHLRTLSGKAYMSRLEELKMTLENIIYTLGSEENTRFTDNLKSVYKDTFYKTTFDSQQFLGFGTRFTFDEKVLNVMVSQKWLGENYSSRIWHNKEKLVSQLETTFLQGIAQGHNPNKIARALNKNLDTGVYNATRLARTEFGHIMGEATLNSYKEQKIFDKYQFVATLDNHTSEICQSLDGEVFLNSEAQEGINYPEMHPNCRSTTIPYFEPDEVDRLYDKAERVARQDNKRMYKVPADMSYPEWKATFAK